MATGYAFISGTLFMCAGDPSSAMIPIVPHLILSFITNGASLLTAKSEKFDRHAQAWCMDLMIIAGLLIIRGSQMPVGRKANERSKADKINKLKTVNVAKF